MKKSKGESETPASGASMPNVKTSTMEVVHDVAYVNVQGSLWDSVEAWYIGDGFVVPRRRDRRERDERLVQSVERLAAAYEKIAGSQSPRPRPPRGMKPPDISETDRAAARRIARRLGVYVPDAQGTKPR